MLSLKANNNFQDKAFTIVTLPECKWAQLFMKYLILHHESMSAAQHVTLPAVSTKSHKVHYECVGDGGRQDSPNVTAGGELRCQSLVASCVARRLAPAPIEIFSKIVSNIFT